MTEPKPEPEPTKPARKTPKPRNTSRAKAPRTPTPRYPPRQVEPGKRGRKHILLAHPDVGTRIIEALRAGNYLSTAARYAGISPDTLNGWLTHAEQPDAPEWLRQFGLGVAGARAEAEVEAVALLRKAGRGGYPLGRIPRVDRATGEVEWEERVADINVRALEFLLERGHAARWGRRQAIEVGTAPEGSPGTGGEGLVVDAERLGVLAARLREHVAAAIGAGELAGDDDVVEGEVVEEPVGEA